MGVALAMPAVPAAGKTLTLKKPAEAVTASLVAFNPRLPHGRSIDFAGRSYETVEAACEALTRDARSVLKKGTKFYVLDGGQQRIWKEGKPTDVDMLAWFYSPTPLTPPLTYRVIAEVTA